MLQSVVTLDDFLAADDDKVASFIAVQGSWGEELASTIPTAPKAPEFMPAAIIVAPLELFVLPKTIMERREDDRRWRVYDGSRIEIGMSSMEVTSNLGEPEEVVQNHDSTVWMYGITRLGVPEWSRFSGLGVQIVEGRVAAVFSDVFLFRMIRTVSPFSSAQKFEKRRAPR